jgi:hypothetical protein
MGRPGIKISLSIEAINYDDQNFVLFTDEDEELVVHNGVLPRS